VTLAAMLGQIGLPGGGFGQGYGSLGYVLTFDRGTAKLAQACSGQNALVEVERWTGALPPIRAYDPPAMERRPDR